MTQSSLGADQQRRAFWLKHLHQWHWISSALCLVGMLLFAVTGFTLNHAGQIEAKPRVQSRTATAPAPVVAALRAPPQGAQEDKDTAPVPAEAARWLRQAFGIEVGDSAAEWSSDEVYVPLPRPGGDAWVSIDRETGEAQYELTTRGWISYLNDLHKGRNTGAAWSVFLDVFALACLVFCVTGLFLLKLHAAGRVATWPMVGLGLVVPVLLALLFIH